MLVFDRGNPVMCYSVKHSDICHLMQHLLQSCDAVFSALSSQTRHRTCGSYWLHLDIFFNLVTLSSQHSPVKLCTGNVVTDSGQSCFLFLFFFITFLSRHILRRQVDVVLLFLTKTCERWDMESWWPSTNLLNSKFIPPSKLKIQKIHGTKKFLDWMPAAKSYYVPNCTH